MSRRPGHVPRAVRDIQAQADALHQKAAAWQVVEALRIAKEAQLIDGAREAINAVLAEYRWAMQDGRIIAIPPLIIEEETLY